MKDVIAQWFVTGLGMAAWGVPFIGVLYLISRIYLSSYISEKGKNLATKDDIGAITKEVERAKEDFSHRLENLKTHNSLAMVAAEKRLSIHQELFNHWRNIHLSVNSGLDSDVERFIDEGEEWLYDNFVYVDGKAREAFLGIGSYIYFCIANGESWRDEDKLREVDKRIDSAQACILKAVSLPAMSAMSFKNMAKDKASPA